MTKNIHVYRTLTLVRIAAVFLLLKYRISNPLDDAYAIWLLAIFCEILFAINLFIYTIVRWRPVDRTTFIDRLSSRYEKPGEGSKLHPVDVFITTADPTREPPMITANTILSVLAVDYPVDKIACYVSDDSASPVIFCMMVEVSKFARKWVPFCKKYSIEPRAPAKFFSPEIDTSTNGSKSSYPEQWKALKISDPASLWFGLALCFQHLMSFLDCRWADATFQEWWNHERFWFIMNSSSYLFGTVESLFKCIGLVETGFTVTPKSQTEDDNACSYAFTDSPLFIPLATLVMLFSVGILAATVHVIKGGTETFSSMFGEYLCGCWSLGIMYPILHQFLTWPKGIDTVPLSVMLPSCVVTTLFCVMVATFLY